MEGHGNTKMRAGPPPERIPRLLGVGWGQMLFRAQQRRQVTVLRLGQNSAQTQELWAGRGASGAVSGG